MRKLIVANWKENPETEAEALKLFEATAKIPRKNVDVAVCPPFVYLEKIADGLRHLKGKKRLALGAQDIFWERTGAYTGEIGPTMLKSLGGTYVIIGHSERRKFLNETDEMVNQKVIAALKAGLKVILCVGEPLAVRKQGFLHAKRYVKAQLAKDLQKVESRKSKVESRLAIAYEPIWAIGTGKNCPPADAKAMAEFIKAAVLSAFRFPLSAILYGGSVHGKNARDYLKYKEIDGLLVGGASLDAKEFGKIVKSTSSF